MRDKLCRPWRYGIFLGRSLNSDQNFVGVPGGDVVRARAFIRLDPSARWDTSKLLGVKTTPLTESTRHFDKIEATSKPKEFHDADATSVERSLQACRAKITLKDLHAHGFSKDCPRCSLHHSQHRRARFHSHTETCRRRMYDALLASGQTRCRRPILPEPRPNTFPGDRLSNHHRLHTSLHPRQPTMPQTTDNTCSCLKMTTKQNFARLCMRMQSFVKTQKRSLLKNHIESSNAVFNGYEHEHKTVERLDVLQCLGVDAATSANVAASLARDRPRFHEMHRRMLNEQRRSISYRQVSYNLGGIWQGGILEAAHGCRRNLTITSLDAPDLLTCKADGSPWNFDLPEDRRLARHMVETLKPTWLIGSPP